MAIMKKYIEAKGTDCNRLELTLDYSLGGYNWYNGKTDGRGYYLYCSPVCVNENTYNGLKYTSVQSVLGRGSKMLLKEVARRSKKAEAEAVELAKAKKDELIKFVCEKYGIELI